mgnify:CR=1 FL=1
MKEFLKKNKKAALIGGVLIGGVLAFYLFRRKKVEFYDNVWCGEANNDCLDIDVQNYTRSSAPRGGNNTGNVNLLFKEKHGLSEGEEIYITQDENSVYDYDGKATIDMVVSPYIVRTNKARMGDSAVVGGYVSKKSNWSEIIS